MPTYRFSSVVTLPDSDDFFDVPEATLKLREPWKAWVSKLDEAGLEHKSEIEPHEGLHAYVEAEAKAAFPGNDRPRVKRTYKRRQSAAAGASSLTQQTPVEPLPTSPPVTAAAE